MNANVKLYKEYSISLDTILRVNNTTMLNFKNIELRVLKYGLCKKSPCDLEKKWAKSVQLVRVASFQCYFLQNPYFRGQ